MTPSSPDSLVGVEREPQIKATRRRQPRDCQGFYGIGIENTKSSHNVGTLWRTAYTFDASFLFTIGKRYQPQCSDTVKAWRHVPMFGHETFEDFYAAIPRDCQLVGVELDDKATPLERFAHPERCVYLLGAEDHGLSKHAKSRCHRLIQLPGRFCLNVAVAGSIVLYHRHAQRAATEISHVA